MTEKEIEKVCVDIACRYDLEFDEYEEILKDSIEEAGRIKEYYTTPVITYSELGLPIINGNGKTMREMYREYR
jgi:hypothetical protein